MGDSNTPVNGDVRGQLKLKLMANVILMSYPCIQFYHKPGIRLVVIFQFLVIISIVDYHPFQASNLCRLYLMFRFVISYYDCKNMSIMNRAKHQFNKQSCVIIICTAFSSCLVLLYDLTLEEKFVDEYDVSTRQLWAVFKYWYHVCWLRLDNFVVDGGQMVYLVFVHGRDSLLNIFSLLPFFLPLGFTLV